VTKVNNLVTHVKNGANDIVEMISSDNPQK